MMKRSSIIVATILTISFFPAGLAFGLDLPEGPPQAPGSSMVPPHHRGPQEPPLSHGMKLLFTCQEINVLAEVTGLSQENIRQLLISSPPPAILEAYGIPFETFAAAMDKQTAKLVKQAAVTGMITNKQEEDILKRMTQKPALPKKDNQ